MTTKKDLSQYPANENRLYQPLLAGLIYFAIVFAIGFILGVVRTLFLIPIIGELLATIVELPIILTAAWLICRRLLHRFNRQKSWTFRNIMGLSAFLLLMVAELALSLILMDRTFVQHLALYQSLPHVLGLTGQIAFAVFPITQR